MAQMATGSFVLEDKKTVKVEGRDDETKRTVYQVSAGVTDKYKVSASKKQGVVGGVARSDKSEFDAAATQLQGVEASQTQLSVSRARAVVVNGRAVKNADFEKLSTEKALQKALTRAVKQSKAKATVVDSHGDKTERLVDDPRVKGVFVTQAFRAKQVFESAKNSESETAPAAAEKAELEAANRAKFQKMLQKALVKSVQQHMADKAAKARARDVEVADD